MKKLFRTLWHGIYLSFWFLVVIFSGLAAILSYAMSIDAGTDAISLGGIFSNALIFGILMISWSKIFLFSRRKLLQYEKFPIMRFQNALALFAGFHFVLVLILLAFYFGLKELIGYEDTYKIGIVYPLFKGIVMVMGSLYIWTLFLDLPFIGIKNYLGQFKKFLQTYIVPFVLYQLAFALITFICNGIVLLMSQNQESATLAATGYFIYVADAERTGGLLGQGVQILSGLTTASSFFVLSSLALDSLKAEENIPWGQRFKRMLFDTDTRQVLIMTILCLIAMVCCHNIDSLPGKLFLFAAAIVWLISAYQFVKETKLLLYLLNFTVMTLIEQAIPTPELTGLLPVLLMVVTMALRILLFSFVALQIGYIYYAQEIHSASKDPSQKTIVDKVTETAYDMSILETGLAAVHLYTNRKQIAKKAAVRLKDKALDKLLGSKK